MKQASDSVKNSRKQDPFKKPAPATSVPLPLADKNACVSFWTTGLDLESQLEIVHVEIRGKELHPDFHVKTWINMNVVDIHSDADVQMYQWKQKPISNNALCWRRLSPFPCWPCRERQSELQSILMHEGDGNNTETESLSGSVSIHAWHVY